MAIYDFIESSGTIIPDTSELLEDVNNEYRDIFGEDFVVDPETPEGILIATEVDARRSVALNNSELANQINPNLSGGVFLDGLWALTGGERRGATRSVVGVVVTGVAGTPIPLGAIASTTAGDQFRSTTTLVIPAEGTITGEFESVLTGPIPADAGTLTQIIDGVVGWETITNPSAATLGEDQESDADSRNRRRNSLALQGRSIAFAIISNLNDVAGVRSLAFRENVEDTTQIIDGITLVAHSVWAAVLGGNDLDIATALLEAKSAGANWNGSVEVDVVEPASGQTFPVKFERPTPRPILVRVTILADSVQSADPLQVVPEAIIAYANGDIPGESGFVVGGDASPFELSSAIGRRNPELFVSLLEISFDEQPPNFITGTLPIALDEVATVTEADIQVLIV